MEPTFIPNDMLITNPVANMSLAQKIGMDLVNTSRDDDENRIEEIQEIVEDNRPTDHSSFD